jgi:hypothetical protein
MTETFGQVVKVITFISLLVLVSCTHTVCLSASGLTKKYTSKCRVKKTLFCV